MEKYAVTGMSCAACAVRIEKEVSKLNGVQECSVNLLTNSLMVEGSVNKTEIVKAVEKAGYGIKEKSETATKNSKINDEETPLLRKRLITSLVFLLTLMYFSMGHTMINLPLPHFFTGNYIATAQIQLLLAVIVMIINHKFFTNGFKSLFRRSPNMDSLVALGSGASFVWSTAVLFGMTAATIEQQAHSMNNLYFESAAMIVTLITFGKMLESYSKGKTTNALKGLMELTPKTAVLIKDGVETEVPIEKVKVNDIFTVRPGESIPVDAIVIEGFSAIDESAITGESIPVDKKAGDTVTAATLNQSGFLKCQALHIGEDTTLSKIIQMVSDAAATKAPIAKIADKVSAVFVPSVILISIITTIIWLLAEKDFGFALARGISVLVISCPCALGLATPVAIMVAGGTGARHGILFKDSESLETTGQVQIVVLDKTGTITQGKPEVTDIIPMFVSQTELLQLALDLENQSRHPLAKAIIKKGEELKLIPNPVTDFSAQNSTGLVCKRENSELFGGNVSFALTKTLITKEIEEKINNLSLQGKTPLLFGKDGKILGIIAAADKVKSDSPKAVQELKNMGLITVMLTGDNNNTAQAIAKECGIDFTIAEVLPNEKAGVIEKLKQLGKTAMAGDGINDAPALTSADTGFGIAEGTDIAIDAANVVLMKSSVSDIAAAIILSRKTLQNIKQNLFWAFIYNTIGIPLAAGLFIPLFGWKLNPMFAAAAMSLSSFCVVTNALRLNFTKIKNIRSPKKIKKTVSAEELKKIHFKETKMKMTVKIEGMMCSHCEMTVKKALEAVDGVKSAEVSHENGNAVIMLSKEVDENHLKTVIEAKDYKVIGFEK